MLVLVSALAGTSAVAWSQDRGRGDSRVRAETAIESESIEERPAADEGSTEEADVVEDRGQKVKVFKFTGLDISGRLKSPQLLYFLNRLRAEFDRPRLPHRSFLPELRRSSSGKSF